MGVILPRMGLGLSLGLGPPNRETPILDLISTAAYAAHGFPLLTLDWAGSAVCRLREDSGDTEDDFFSDIAGNLRNTSGQTVAAWLTANSASNAFVHTIYDQTGNGRHWTQTTNANQPLFSESAFSGKPGATFNGSSQGMLGDGMSGAFTGSDSPHTLVGALQIDSPFNALKTMVSASSTTDTNPLHIYRGKNADDVYQVVRRPDSGSGTVVIDYGTINGSPNIHSWRFAGTTIDVWVNGTQILDDTAINTTGHTMDAVTLGAVRNGSSTLVNHLEGAMATTVLFNSAISDADLAIVRQGLINYYGA